MDDKSPLQETQAQEIAKDEPAMATLVAAPAPATLDPTPSVNNAAHAAVSGVNKRYRPAPAKTFQCRGYGDCRMVFSRSEHLARHIRKHTGERPFTCHCGKQFSRLDNLRQHAQTVHADKQEMNDKMMRDLTSLHASMTAATKGGSARAKRGSLVAGAGGQVNNTNSTGSSSPTDGDNTKSVKQEDAPSSIPAIASQHPRPGTSTGYEGDNGIIYQHIQGSNQWHLQNPNNIAGNPRPSNNYSFRDSTTGVFNQSFRTSPTNYHYFGQYPAGQSFLASTNNTSPNSSGLGSSHSRSSSDARSLPPIATVVSSSLTAPPPQPPHNTYILTQPPPPSAAAAANILPLPNPTIVRRPSTSASRPTTAPAAYYYPHPGSGSFRQLPYGHGLGFSGPELSIPVYGGGKLGSGLGYGNDVGPTSPTSGESPFSFHPPALAEPQQSSLNPRKRPFPGSDDDNVPNGNVEYDYGTESRPQSRRLSVMELCNDTDVPPPRTASGESRPGSRAVISSLSAATDEHPRTSSGALRAGDKTSAGRTDASATPSPVSSPGTDRGLGHGGSPQITGRRILQISGDSNRLPKHVSSSPIFSAAGPPTEDSAISPRPAAAYGAPSRVTHGVTRTGSGNAGAGAESPGSDKVRIATGYTPVGMKA